LLLSIVCYLAFQETRNNCVTSRHDTSVSLTVRELAAVKQITPDLIHTHHDTEHIGLVTDGPVPAGSGIRDTFALEIGHSFLVFRVVVEKSDMFLLHRCLFGKFANLESVTNGPTSLGGEATVPIGVQCVECDPHCHEAEEHIIGVDFAA
jgi:hypothetical protein